MKTRVGKPTLRTYRQRDRTRPRESFLQFLLCFLVIETETAAAASISLR